MALLTKRAVLAMKTEGTSGTAESLSASDGDINCYYEPGAFQWDIPVTPRPEQGSFNKLAGVPGARMVRLQFETDVVGTGASGSVSTELTALIKACGYTESGGTFTPTSVPANMTTVTIAHYLDGLKRVAVGCAGNLQVRIRNGQISRFIFSFTGKYGGETDVALITPTFPTTIPPRGAASVSVSGVTTGLTDEMLWDKGNVIKLREKLTDATGYLAAIITDDAPTVTTNPETLLVAGLDVDAALLNSTEAALTCTMGSTSNNTIALAAVGSKAQLVQVADAARDGLAVRNFTYNLNRAFTVAFS